MLYKGNITLIPTYNDGIFEIFEIKQESSVYPKEKIVSTNKKMCYEELSVSDKLKFFASERDVDITMKIRIPQTKQINSMNVLKIENEYHKVYNAFHFTNKNGFKQTDLTLTNYEFR